ncbi:hypothetical protein CC86DRAFT_29361 [Ophiobolus disseminans]|uniref:Uncharacterized protein n=1 Tax=Ophiobolus disseminans TaxID=1469910 RepID=A0A6A7A0W8_9PLEO|nr:hypothetical protein CC86DRAFT_29361 [Ophiobolus disseminans]
MIASSPMSSCAHGTAFMHSLLPASSCRNRRYAGFMLLSAGSLPTGSEPQRADPMYEDSSRQPIMVRRYGTIFAIDVPM